MEAQAGTVIGGYMALVIPKKFLYTIEE